MALKKTITRKRVEAMFDLLDRIETELPTRSVITISDDGGEEEIELGEERSVEVADIEVVIDIALLEFQNSGILPKKKKGTYTLSSVFETLFGRDSLITELAVDLETTLSGYNDMILSEGLELARELIEQISSQIREETSIASAPKLD